MNDKIKLTKADGATIDTDIICYIENTSSGKKFLYYTLNEVAGAGPSSTVKIYVTNIKQDNPALDTAITDQEWEALKGYMGDALKGTTNPEVKYLSVQDLQNPVGVSERAIAMPTSYDYITKQRGIFAEAIAKAQPAATTTPEPISGPAVEETSAPIVPTEPQTPIEPAAEPAPVVEPTPVAPIEPAPSMTETPSENKDTPAAIEPVVEETVITDTPAVGMGTQLTPIDIASIENKYKEMFDTLNRLKEQELEAANRYNATLELSDMHKEQHANYVQNEQMKESISNPAFDVPATDAVVNANEVNNALDTNPTPTATIEPSPAEITPIEASPTPQAMETNWFDMPANN